MEKIKIPIASGVKESDLSGGTICHISWHTISDAIGKAILLQENEEVKGLVVTDEGIKVHLQKRSL